MRAILQEIMTVTRREWSLILRDKKLRLLLLLAPLINALIVCGVYAPSYVNDVPIALVQQDASALSLRLGRWLDQHQKIKVLATVPDVAAAEALFEQGKIAAYVLIEEDMTRRVKRNEEARVLLFCDATHMVLANTLSASVQAVVQTFNVGLAVQKARKLGAFKDQAQALVLPLRTEIRPLGNPSFSYADFMLPGMLLAVLQQVILLGLALSWAGEREQQTLPELQALSTRAWVLILGKNLPHFLLHLGWLLIFFSLLLPFSQVSSAAHWSSLAVFSLLFVLVILGWGTWVSLCLGERLGATQALMFLAVPSFILSGYTWPEASLPAPLQALSQILPLTHSAIMLRKIMGMGLDLGAFPREVATLGLLILVHGALALWALRRYQGTTKSRHDISVG